MTDIVERLRKMGGIGYEAADEIEVLRERNTVLEIAHRQMQQTLGAAYAELDRLRGEVEDEPKLPESYIKNCFIVARPGETLFHIHGDRIVVCLERYAVIPLKDYERLHAEIERLQGLNNGLVDLLRLKDAELGKAP